MQINASLLLLLLSQLPLLLLYGFISTEQLLSILFFRWERVSERLQHVNVFFTLFRF